LFADVEETIRMNFSETSLKDVLKVINKKTKARFLFEDSLLEGKTISFYADRPMPVSSLLNTLTTILETQGLALLRVGKGDASIYKVVEIKSVATKSSPIYRNDNFDQIPESDEVITIMYELKHLVPVQLEKPLSKLTSIPNAVTAIEGTSILRVTDVASHTKKLIKLLESMDQKGSSIDSTTIKLNHVKASEIASELKPIIDVENNKMRNSIKNRIARTLQENAKRSRTVAVNLDTDFLRPIVVNPIDRLNSIFLSGTDTQLQIMKGVIAKLDVPAERRNKIHFIDIKHGDPEQIAITLSTLFNEGGKPTSSRRRGRRGRPSPSQSGLVFNPDPIKNRILIMAPEEEMVNIKEVIAKLDQTPEDELVLRSYAINHADPTAVFDVINRMYAPMIRLKNAKRLPLFQLSYDSTNQALWIRCSKKIHDEVKDTITNIDIEGEDDRVLVSYPLEYADVIEASRMLKEVLNINSKNRDRNRRGGLQQHNDVITVDRSNSALLIYAQKKTHELIVKALETIDISSDGDLAIKYYSVKNIALLDAVHLLNHLFAFRSSVTTPGNRAARNQREKLILDENSGQIIVIASTRTHKKVVDTLKKIDVQGLGNNVLKYYPIENTTATEAAKTIQQLFGLPISAPRQNRNTPAQRGLALLRNSMVLANIESNTVIVNAPLTTHKAIAELLKSMNEISKVDKMTVRFYALENTNAEDIAGEIAELFSLKLGTGYKNTQTKGRNMRNSQKSRSGSLLRPMRPDETENNQGSEAQTQTEAPKKANDRNSFFFNGEPTVIPETNLNSIILVAPNYLHEEVNTTIKTMDKRRPQVMVEVAIIEVAEGSDLDFGVELSRITGRNAGLTNFGLTQPNSTTRFPSDGPVKTDLTGLISGFIRADGTMPIILNALKSDNKLNIRSTPSLLVNDNERAVFSSLQEEPTTSTSQGTATTKISFAGFVQAGTSLTITPHISQGKYIRLEIDLKVESFTGEVVTPGIPPPKSSNSLVTSVTVPDENLAIIGGMVSEKRQNIERKVPLLGDIPILGHAFKRQTKGKAKSRLYLFIKPKILRDASFADLKKISIQKQQELNMKTRKVEVVKKVIGEKPKSSVVSVLKENGETIKEEKSNMLNRRGRRSR
jgi:type II secretory pathway component GspD/PulD (secretin)